MVFMFKWVKNEAKSIFLFKWVQNEVIVNFTGQTSQEQCNKWFLCSNESNMKQIQFSCSNESKMMILWVLGVKRVKNNTTNGFHVQTSQKWSKMNFLVLMSPKWSYFEFYESNESRTMQQVVFMFERVKNEVNSIFLVYESKMMILWVLGVKRVKNNPTNGFHFQTSEKWSKINFLVLMSSKWRYCEFYWSNKSRTMLQLVSLFEWVKIEAKSIFLF